MSIKKIKDDFFDSPISVDTLIERNSNRIDPLLYSNSDDPFVYVVIEKPLSKKIIDNFLRCIKNEIYNKDITGKPATIKIISILPFEPTEKELSKNIIDFYASNTIDLKKYIKPYSKIICTGRSIYSLVGSDDLLD